jgi:hypothetical protein
MERQPFKVMTFFYLSLTHLLTCIEVSVFISMLSEDARSDVNVTETQNVLLHCSLCQQTQHGQRKSETLALQGCPAFHMDTCCRQTG